jgi:hypothetical protein
MWWYFMWGVWRYFMWTWNKGKFCGEQGKGENVAFLCEQGIEEWEVFHMNSKVWGLSEI